MCSYSIPFHGCDKDWCGIFTRGNVAVLEPSGGITLLISIVPLDIFSFSVPLPVTEPVEIHELVEIHLPSVTGWYLNRHLHPACCKLLVFFFFLSCTNNFFGGGNNQQKQWWALSCPNCEAVIATEQQIVLPFTWNSASLNNSWCFSFWLFVDLYLFCWGWERDLSCKAGEGCEQTLAKWSSLQVGFLLLYKMFLCHGYVLKNSIKQEPSNYGQGAI